MRGFIRGPTLQFALLLALLATGLLHTSATPVTARQPDAAALLGDARATLDVGRSDEGLSSRGLQWPDPLARGEPPQS
jgi:hypothetical protein